MASEQIQTSRKKGRGMAKASLDLIAVMHEIAEASQPITGRGVGYKLFTRGLIPSMSTNSMQKVYRLLTIARENGDIPWEWIVDESRSLERRAQWDNPWDFSHIWQNYRRDRWNDQPHRVEVWSEKGTVRGVLAPVLREYGVGFRVMHGFTSATVAHDVAEDDDGRPLIALYAGDWDPSGLCMSEVDLPERLERYEGEHIELRRIALQSGDLEGLPSFPAADKAKDPRYRWFVSNYGDRCWELDAMDPNDLRARVEAEIKSLIDENPWKRAETIEAAERETLSVVLKGWGANPTPSPPAPFYRGQRPQLRPELRVLRGGDQPES